jgi:transcriptional regulator with XRE-family HTH domain
MADTLYVRLGRRIQKLRRPRAWRQIDLAAHAELSKTHICDLERGHREVGLLALRRIANALDLKTADLLKNLD